MESKGTNRSAAYLDNCLACDRKLIGRGTKRVIPNIGYVCYGRLVCGDPAQRELWLEKASF